MTWDCYCDYDPPEFVSVRMQKARKPFRCEECSGEVHAGERYEYVFGKWDGLVASYRTCSHCVEIRQFVSVSIPCFCWAYGNMIDDAKEAVSEAYFRAREEVSGLWFGFGRRLIARNRHNRARRHGVAS